MIDAFAIDELTERLLRVELGSEEGVLDTFHCGYERQVIFIGCVAD